MLLSNIKKISDKQRKKEAWMGLTGLALAHGTWPHLDGLILHQKARLILELLNALLKVVTLIQSQIYINFPK